MAITLQTIPVKLDFSVPSKTIGANFVVMQGSNNANLNIKFTVNGFDISSGSHYLELYLVTTDSLDFRNSVRAITDEPITITYNPSNGINLTYASSDDVSGELVVPEIFQTKGHCQLIFYIDGTSTLPLDYYVIDNPSYIIATPSSQSNNSSSNNNDNNNNDNPSVITL